MHRRHASVVLVLALSLVLAACGGPPNGGPPSGGPTTPDPTPQPTDSGLTELIEAVDTDGNLDVEVGVRVVAGPSPAGVSTAAAGVVTPVLLEVDATTPGGRPFRAVLVGSSERALAEGFEGAMRVQARATEVNGQPILVGFAALRDADATIGTVRFDGFSFLATRPGVSLVGPPVGAVYNFDGDAAFAGFCTEDHLTGAALFRNRNDSVRVVNAALGRLDERLSCAVGTRVTSDARVHMEGEVAGTRLGNVLVSYGAMQVRRGERVATLPLFAIGVPERLSDAVRQERFAGDVADGTYVLEPFAMAALEGVRDGTMFFRALPESLAGVEAGDLLVARPYPRLPEGLLRKVSGVRTLPQGIAIDTEPAELTDLLRDGGFAFDRPLTADDVVEAIAHSPGVDLSAFDAPAGEVGTASLSLLPRIRFDEEVFAGVQVVGSLDISIRPVVSFRCAGVLCTQPAIVGKFVVDQSASVEVIGTAGFGGAKKFDLATIKLGTITVLIPPVPVTITPVLVVSLTVSGNGTVGFETRVEQTLTLEAGVEKPSGAPWRRVSELERTFDYDPPSFDGQVTAEARLALAAEARVYGGLLYAGADIGGFVRFTGQIPGSPTWLLEGGVNSFAYFGIDVIVISYEDEFKVFERTWPIASAPNAPPSIGEPVITTTYAPFVLGEETIIPRALVGEPVSFATTVTDVEDGSACCEVDWFLTAPGGAITRQDSTGGNPEVEFTPTQLGRYTLRAVAYDAQRGSAERTLTFDVVSAFGLTELLEASLAQITFGAPQVGDAVTFEARFDDPFDLDCCELAWRVTRLGSLRNGLLDVGTPVLTDPTPGLGGDGVLAEFTTTSSTGQHLHTRTFDAAGLYLVEVTPLDGKALVFADGPSFNSLLTRRLEVTVEREPTNPPRVNWISTGPAEVRVGEGFVFNWSVDWGTDGPDRSVRVLTRDEGSEITIAFRQPGQPGQGGNIAGWTYETTGTKTVTVIAIDDDGLTDTLEATIDVLPLFSVDVDVGGGGGLDFGDRPAREVRTVF